MKKLLVISIICILLGVIIVPIVNTYNKYTNLVLTTENIAQTISNGNILYVGGSGPNNYTKIQDAIDDAQNGDTVFVYDDSSPYYENIRVNKAIKLVGEDNDTTIIDGKKNGNVIYISADWVNISGFMVRNSGRYNKGGIYVYSSNRTSIYGNNLFDNARGVMVGGQYNNISNNFINNEERTNEDTVGIYVMGGENNTITKNHIRNNDIGIMSYGSYTNVLYNTISSSGWGVVFNRLKVGFTEGGFNEIHYNNFIFNEVHASFIWGYGAWVWDIINVGNWNWNYWSGWLGLLPKPIVGFINLFPYSPPELVLPNFDWHPATEPYEW